MKLKQTKTQHGFTVEIHDETKLVPDPRFQRSYTFPPWSPGGFYPTEDDFVLYQKVTALKNYEDEFNPPPDVVLDEDIVTPEDLAHMRDAVEAMNRPQPPAEEEEP